MSVIVAVFLLALPHICHAAVAGSPVFYRVKGHGSPVITSLGVIGTNTAGEEITVLGWTGTVTSAYSIEFAGSLDGPWCDNLTIGCVDDLRSITNLLEQGMITNDMLEAISESFLSAQAVGSEIIIPMTDASIYESGRIRVRPLTNRTNDLILIVQMIDGGAVTDISDDGYWTITVPYGHEKLIIDDLFYAGYLQNGDVVNIPPPGYMLQNLGDVPPELAEPAELDPALQPVLVDVDEAVLWPEAQPVIPSETVTVAFEMARGYKGTSPTNGWYERAMCVSGAGGMGYLTAAQTADRDEPHNGTRIVTVAHGRSPIRIENMEGRTFRPVSIDLAEYSHLFVEEKDIPITVYRHDGTSTTVVFRIDGRFNQVMTDDFQTFQFPNNIGAAAYLEIGTDIFAFDNLHGVVEGLITPPPPDPRPEPEQPTYNAPGMTTLAYGSYCGINKELFLEITNQQQWDEFWTEYTANLWWRGVPLDVNFSNETVIVLIGKAPVAGVSMEFTGLVEMVGEVTMTARAVAPGPSVALRAGESQPHHIVKIERTGKPVFMTLTGAFNDQAVVMSPDPPQPETYVISIPEPEPEPLAAAGVYPYSGIITLAQGSHCGIDRVVIEKITNQTEWAAFWAAYTSDQSNAPALPPVDFSVDMVIASIGQADTMGHSLETMGRSESGGLIRLHATSHSPAPGVPHGIGSAQPHHVVRTAKSDNHVYLVITDLYNRWVRSIEAGPPTGVYSETPRLPAAAVALPGEYPESGFVTIRKGDHSGINGAIGVKITNQTEWASFWTAHTSDSFPPDPLPQIEFSQDMVVGIMRVASSGSSYLTIANMTENAHEIGFEVTSGVLGNLAVMTQPHHIIRIPLTAKTLAADFIYEGAVVASSEISPAPETYRTSY